MFLTFLYLSRVFSCYVWNHWLALGTPVFPSRWAGSVRPTGGVTLWCRLSLIGCWDWAGIRKSAGIMRVPDEETNRWWVSEPTLERIRTSGVTLVDELVEGVLPVGPRFAPHNWSRVVVDPAAVFGDVLPVGLHVALETKHRPVKVLGSEVRSISTSQVPSLSWGTFLNRNTSVFFCLCRNHSKNWTIWDPEAVGGPNGPTFWTHLLEVGGEAVHVLVIRQHGVSLSLEEVDVPDAQKSQQNRCVLVQRGAAEMVVLETRHKRRELAEPTEPKPHK